MKQIPGFRSFSETVNNAVEVRKAVDASKLCITGIPYLDSQLDNIYPSELIVLAADSGIGKTSLSSTIAQANVKRHHNVACLFLESDISEFEQGQLWQELCRRHSDKIPAKTTFRQYQLNKLSHLEWLAAEEEKIKKEMAKEREGLMLLDKASVGPVNEGTIENILTRICQFVDLIIIDHLHYFDKTYHENMNTEITKIMKKLKAFTMIHKTPIVLVSHVNKSQQKDMIIMDKTDLRGSSSIYQEANECIVISQYHKDPQYDATNIRQPTLFRFVKSRSGISKFRLGRHLFNRATKSYEKGFREYLLRENVYNSETRRTEYQTVTPIN